MFFVPGEEFVFFLSLTLMIAAESGTCQLAASVTVSSVDVS